MCPACRLAAQAFWLEDREVADRTLESLEEEVPADVEEAAPECALHSKEMGAFAIATVLTSEDLFRSIRHDGQGREDAGEDDLADANAIVLAYVDALRTLAYSIRTAATRSCDPPRPFWVARLFSGSFFLIHLFQKPS